VASQQLDASAGAAFEEGKSWSGEQSISRALKFLDVVPARQSSYR
jgi:hypothetical protein